MHEWLETLPEQIKIYAKANIEILQSKLECDEHDAAQLVRWQMLNGLVRLPRIEVHQHPDGSWPNVWWSRNVDWIPSENIAAEKAEPARQPAQQMLSALGARHGKES